MASIANKFNKIYTVEDTFNKDIFKNLSCDRGVFAKIMTAIKNNKEEKNYSDLVAYFNILRKKNLIDKNIKYNQFIFFMLVMEELSILAFIDGKMEITGNKSNLHESSIYNFIHQLLENK